MLQGWKKKSLLLELQPGQSPFLVPISLEKLHFPEVSFPSFLLVLFPANKTISSFNSRLLPEALGNSEGSSQPGNLLGKSWLWLPTPENSSESIPGISLCSRAGRKGFMWGFFSLKKVIFFLWFFFFNQKSNFFFRSFLFLKKVIFFFFPFLPPLPGSVLHQR